MKGLWALSRRPDSSKDRLAHTTSGQTGRSGAGFEGIKLDLAFFFPLHVQCRTVLCYRAGRAASGWECLFRLGSRHLNGFSD